MTFREMGEVFAHLLAYREVSADPLFRRLRRDEKRIADLLERAMLEDFGNFEAFLHAQGFSLKFYDSTYFGKAFDKRETLRSSSYFVLIRSDHTRAAYMDRDWFDKNFSDARRVSETKTERVVWGIQLWLTLQSLYYTRLGRSVTEVSRFDEAVVTEREFVAAVSDFIEKMRNQGRPQGEKGHVWDIFVKEERTGIASRVKKFLEIMERAGMVDKIKGNEGSVIGFRQTLLAATEMSFNADRGFDYLVPPETDSDKMASPDEVIKGRTE
jgi:hypothetical protein